MSESEPKQQRRHPRYGCDGRAELRRPEATDNSGALRQISAGGCYINTPDPAPVGTHLELTLQVGQVQLRAEGTVLYSHPEKGMGVAFTKIDDEMRAMLDQFLTDLAQSIPPI